MGGESMQNTAIHEKYCNVEFPPLTACHSDSAWRAEQPKDGFSTRCAEGYM